MYSSQKEIQMLAKVTQPRRHERAGEFRIRRLGESVYVPPEGLDLADTLRWSPYTPQYVLLR